MSRKLNDEEWEDLSQAFPSLVRATVLVTGEESKLYNCIAWTLGLADQWINIEPATEPGFDTFYKGHNYAKSEVIGSIVAIVDGWGDADGIMKHGSRKSTVSAGQFESKLGPDIRITHGRFELVGQEYGAVLTSYLAPKIMEQATVPTPKIAEPSAELTGTEKAAIQTAADAVDPGLKTQYAQLLAAWRATNDRPPLKFSSNSRDFAQTPAADALAQLGKQALPLFLETMASDADGFFLLPLVERLVVRTDLSVRTDHVLESQQSLARTAIRTLMR